MKCPVLIIILFAFFTPLLSAQTKELTKHEYAVLAYGAQAKTEREMRRVKTVHIYQNGVDVGDVISETIEYEPSINEYSLTIRKAAKGTIREEYILADEQEFVRQGTGRWKRKKKDRRPIPTTIGTGAVTDGSGDSPVKQETEVFRRVGSEMIDGHETQVIEKIWTIVDNVGSSKRTSEFYQRLWIQSDGRVKKEESRSTENGNAWSHTVSVYEYDPTIKIEAPIRSAKQRK
ncbi:MAG: hypothetical protein ABL984_05835 [Pyrinomonadaceae bacterium]